MRYIQLVWVCILLLFLPGCWDYAKINNRAFVIGIGVDPVEGNQHLLQFTFQIPNLEASAPQSMGGGGQSSAGGSGSQSYKNFTVNAPTFHTALVHAQTEFDKVFYLSNVEVIILNTKLTQNAVNELIEELMRDETIDKSSVLVASDVRPGDILGFKGNTPPATQLASIVGLIQGQHAYIPVCHLWEFWRDAKNIASCPHAPLVSFQGNDLRVGGLAYYQGYQFKGELDTEQAVMYNLLTRATSYLSLAIPVKGDFLEIRVGKSRNSVSVMRQNGKLVLRDKIRIHCELGGAPGNVANNITDIQMQRYEALVAQYIEQHARTVMQKLQRDQCDVLDFGRWYAIHNPSELEAVSAQWPNWFSKAIPLVQVKVAIIRKGNLI